MGIMGCAGPRVMQIDISHWRRDWLLPKEGCLPRCQEATTDLKIGQALVLASPRCTSTTT
jgi:hypothetical protein